MSFRLGTMLSHAAGDDGPEADAFADAASSPAPSQPSSARRSRASGVRFSNQHAMPSPSLSQSASRRTSALPRSPAPAPSTVVGSQPSDMAEAEAAAPPKSPIAEQNASTIAGSAASSRRTSKRYSTVPGGMVTLEPPRPAAAPVKMEPEEPQPRLIMTKMVLMNFKSYAGRVEVGPFHEVRSPHGPQNARLNPVYFISRLPRSLDRMDQESRTSSMRSSLFLDGEQRSFGMRKWST